MDYEWHIKVAERELAHLREMQAIHRAHMDVTDRAIDTIGTTLERIETAVEKLAVMQGVTETKLQTLIDLLTHLHANGKGGK